MEGERLDRSGAPSRRELLRRAAAVGAVVWAAPVLQSARPALAQQSPPPAPLCRCGGEAFDVIATFTGPVHGKVGPVRAAPPSDCFADLSVTAPTKAQPFLVSKSLCVEVEGSGQADSTCMSRSEIENLTVDLRKVDGLLNVRLNVSVLLAQAWAKCGGGGATGSSSLTTAILKHGSNTTGLAVSPAPNTTIQINVPLVAVGSLVLNEQTDVIDEHAVIIGKRVSAIHLNVRQPLTTQVVDLVISRAESSCECPDPPAE